MCLIALALAAHPRWPLVIAANRDEDRRRPAAPLARWHVPGGAELLSGRDLQDGGTWLGATPTGRVAMLTNVRNGAAARGPRSRGELATGWLAGDAAAPGYLSAIDPAAYGGFNLITGDWRSGAWHYASNQAALPHAPLPWQVLAPGIHGLSNAALNTPWPKTVALKERLTAALADAGDTADLTARLLVALRDTRRAPAAALPATGVPAAVEAALSSAWIDMPEAHYGTRCSTVLVVERAADGRDTLHASETTWAPDAAPTVARYSLSW